MVACWKDSQACMTLLLLNCAAPRSNYLLRFLAPSFTDEFVCTHDNGVARCLADLLANDTPIYTDDLSVADVPRCLFNLHSSEAWDDAVP